VGESIPHKGCHRSGRVSITHELLPDSRPTVLNVSLILSVELDYILTILLQRRQYGVSQMQKKTSNKNAPNLALTPATQETTYLVVDFERREDSNSPSEPTQADSLDSIPPTNVLHNPLTEITLINLQNPIHLLRLRPRRKQKSILLPVNRKNITQSRLMHRPIS
jgi:hypothetical protein